MRNAAGLLDRYVRRTAFVACAAAAFTLWPQQRQRVGGKFFEGCACVAYSASKKPLVAVFLLLAIIRFLTFEVVYDREVQGAVPVCLGALEEVFDVDVGVWERVAAENNLIHFAQGHVCAVPDRTEEDIVQLLVEGRRHDQGRVDTCAVRARGMGEIRYQAGDHSLFLGREFEFIAGRTEQPVQRTVGFEQ